MKHSIRFKITFLLTALIIITIFLTWFINHSFLSDYYLYNKFAILDDAYQEINAVYKAEEGDALSDEDILKIEKISTKYGVGTYIY
ncbi:MAG TPA: two-component sensor histidine kinase, partial [Lachnospiraceae bacterium]|nr:two-component sensor histidine kinase [Lachnospiraceae bacterium]